MKPTNLGVLDEKAKQLSYEFNFYSYLDNETPEQTKHSLKHSHYTFPEG